LHQVRPAAPMPDEQILTAMLLRDTDSHCYGDITTPKKEGLAAVLTTAANKASLKLAAPAAHNTLESATFKNTSIFHLLKDAVPSVARRGLPVGGYGNIINAITASHGPSWRMIVHLTQETEAYAVYTAGQSGTPGSPYYDNFIDTWTKGEMYKLLIMKPGY